MSYTYKVLVIDDNRDMSLNFEPYMDFLQDEGYFTKFDLVSSNVEFKSINVLDYDILMVDYNLKQGFFSNSNNSMGTDFLRTFRKENRVSKIIFYSSEFTYDKDNRTNNQIRLSPTEIFQLINDFKVDFIVPKNNFNLVVKTIGECINDLDVIAKLLINLSQKFEGDDEHLIYSSPDGKDFTVKELLRGYLSDSDDGRQFREQLLSTVATVLFKYEY